MRKLYREKGEVLPSSQTDVCARQCGSNVLRCVEQSEISLIYSTTSEYNRNMSWAQLEKSKGFEEKTWCNEA